MGIYVGDNAIKCIYLGDTPLKAVYLGDTKIRPTITEALIDFLLVGGGGAGGQSWGIGGGGGGAGGVVYCEGELLQTGTYNVCIGKGGCGYKVSTGTDCKRSGEDSCFMNYVACGGGGGGYGCASGTGYLSPNGYNGASGGGGARCGTGGTGTQGCNGGAGVTGNTKFGGSGGGGYTSEGCIAFTTGTGILICQNGGDGGLGYSSDITGQTEYYAYGGGGGASTRGTPGTGYCGGGNGGRHCACPNTRCADGHPATTYGSGGGGSGGWCTCCSGRTYGGDGCQGVFIARYPASCGYNITGGTKYLCNGYCIHCFTSDGTLTVN